MFKFPNLVVSGVVSYVSFAVSGVKIFYTQVEKNGIDVLLKGFYFILDYGWISLS